MKRSKATRTIRSGGREPPRIRIHPRQRAGQAHAGGARGTLSLSGGATLAAIAAVLVLVSLPCLNDFALQENELDAAATLRLLARELERREEAPQGSRIEELASRSAVLRELTDAEFLDGGRLLRRHGYLFSLVPCAGALPPPGPGVVLAGPPAASPGGSALVAWPWSHGRTGHTALVAHPQGGVLGHPNLEGSWSGLEHPPVGFCSGADGWRPLR